jgi:hypothetical protein
VLPECCLKKHLSIEKDILGNINFYIVFNDFVSINARNSFPRGTVEALFN